MSIPLPNDLSGAGVVLNVNTGLVTGCDAKFRAVNYPWRSGAEPNWSTLRLVTQFTASPPTKQARAIEVTWFGFRSDNRNRLPEFYACVRSNPIANPRADDLYELGAVGNAFDVDILLTDQNGGPIQAGIYENGNPVNVNFYRAKRALSTSNGSTNKMELRLGANETRILWVVSFKHHHYGSRDFDMKRRFTMVSAKNSLAFNSTLDQDDDGSPGDPEPGGEGE